MEFVSRLTLTLSVPASFVTAFSTLAEHAEQVMPVMANRSFFMQSPRLTNHLAQKHNEFIHYGIIACANIVNHAAFDMLGQQFLIKCS